MKRKVPLWDPFSAHSFWINHASRLLLRQFEQSLRPIGFGWAYFPVVMALENDGPLLQRELAERAHVEQPTMAALLGRMERDGLIAREPHPTDGRASRIKLTRKAKAAVPKARARLTEVAARVTLGFDAAERAAFMGFLRRAVANLDASE